MDIQELPKLEHDQVVLQHALALLAEGYEVKARLEGLFEPPQIIYGYRPDVVARLGDRVVIVEVVKGEVDWPKVAAFERYAAEHPEQKLELVNA